MLKKEQRLRGLQDFERIYKTGRRAFTQHLRLFCLKTDQNSSRFGFVISKGQVRQAAKRNRLKRILRAEIVEMNKHFFKGYDVIIQAGPGIIGLSAQQIRLELGQLLIKSGIISK